MDETDHAIIEVLRRNARTPVADIARAVGLSPAPVARRIDRLERDGVIKAYVAVVDDSLTGEIEAFTEVRLNGGLDTAEIEDIARAIPEVQQCFTIAGDTDALLRFRAANVDHLQQVVNSIRRSGKVAGTKSLIVMRSWDRTTPDP